MDLVDYERAKFELAEALRLLSLLVRGGDPYDPDWLRDLFARLAEDRFNLVVAGRFSRGKTSLMNAMLGSDRLPVGIVPLTSVITRVAYGSCEQALITYQDGRRPATKIALDELPEYVTQQRNPGNARAVRTAEVSLPAEILRRGFHFVDTPGLGSSIAENTRTTEEFLPEADAFLLVSGFDSPLSTEEMAVLREAAVSARRAFLVINKQDTVSPEERDAALAYVRDQLATVFAEEAPAMFAVSARQGLAARLAGNGAALTDSGVLTLEAELIRFLLEEKRSQFLLRLTDRIVDRVRDLPASAEAQHLAETLFAFSQRIADSRPGAALRADTALASEPAPAVLRRWHPCEVCTAIVKATFDYLCHFQYQLSISPEAQQDHAGRGGLCAPHTLEYGALASSQGICTGYPPVLERLAQRLREITATMPSTADGASTMSALRPSADNCVVCAEQLRAEREAIDRIGRRPSADRDDLSALCLPHLEMLVASLEDVDLARALMSRESSILDRLAEDMRRYALKRDAVRRALVSDEETHADQHALAVLAGLKTVHPMARRR